MLRSVGSELRYVLITPARNEERYISVDARVDGRARPIRPLRWVIVSDGSTDRTDEIVNEYRRRCDWIDLFECPSSATGASPRRSTCFNAGLDDVKDLQFDVVGSLDADISFEPDYFEFLLGKFGENPRLGVAGTPFVENGRHYDYRFTNIEHVSGACQLFRRECFEDIGGYVPIKGGGIDWTAVTTARMKGWQTRTFTERPAFIIARWEPASASQLEGFFRHGQKDYYLGGHPLWQLFRCRLSDDTTSVSDRRAVPPGWVPLGVRASTSNGRFLRSSCGSHRAEQMARLRSHLLGAEARSGARA